MPITCNFWKPIIPLSMGGQYGVAKPLSNTQAIPTVIVPSVYSNSADSSAPSSGVGLAQLGWKEGRKEEVAGGGRKGEDRH